MNILNLALGGLSGGGSGSPLVALTGSPLTARMTQLSSGTVNAASPATSRDGLISDLPQISSLVNSLQQAATGAPSDTAGMQLTVPADAPMPTPKSAPAVPTDDHGQSNVVFTDSAADGAFIA